jgi:hypothetical protein
MPRRSSMRPAPSGSLLTADRRSGFDQKVRQQLLRVEF